MRRGTEKNEEKDLCRLRRQRARPYSSEREERTALLERAGGLEPVGMEGMVSGARALRVPHTSRGQIEPPVHSDSA